MGKDGKCKVLLCGGKEMRMGREKWDNLEVLTGAKVAKE